MNVKEEEPFVGEAAFHPNEYEDLKAVGSLIYLFMIFFNSINLFNFF